MTKISREGADIMAPTHIPTASANESHAQETQHSPLPWNVGGPNLPSVGGEEGACGVEDREGMTICDTWPSANVDSDSPLLARANAEFIVRACNNHEALLDALRTIEALICDQPLCGHFTAEEIRSVVHAAIAKVEGK